jgi:hypothetical protein
MGSLHVINFTRVSGFDGFDTCFPFKPSQTRFAALADLSDPNSNLMTIGQNSWWDLNLW